MRAKFLCLAGLATVFFSLGAQGALIDLGQNPTSPYYADFDNKGLDVSYSFANGVGTISVSNHSATAKSTEGYTSQSLAAGTHGQGHPGTATGFTGYYTLNATVAQNPNDGGAWEVTGGNFSVLGDLFNLGNPTHQKDLLLTGTLQTGSGSFGFDSTIKELDFLFTTQASLNGTQANQTILEDFMGAGIGSGGIKLNYGALGFMSSAFNLQGTWFNNGNGIVSTFVPEPVCYPFAAAGIAMAGLVAIRRKSLA